MAASYGQDKFLGVLRMNVQSWLWIGCIGMLVGMVLLYLPLFNNRKAREEAELASHFYVPLFAFTSYLAMALGAGKLITEGGRVFYYARYVDWSITTPLLLWSLVYSGLQGTNFKRPALIAGLLGADVYMIVTGFIAGRTDNMTLKFSFYITSCISFLFIYLLLFGPFKKITATGPHAEAYAKKSVVLAVLWFAYPVVFILGQEGIKSFSAGFDAACYTILDLVTKVVYGLWAVSLAKKSISAVPEYPNAHAVAR